MPTPSEIIDFSDDPAPPGASPWVGPRAPERIEMVPADPSWPAQFDAVADRVRGALGPRVLELHHVGSTSVPDLDAKPIIDVDLIVADPSDEAAWLPPLEAAGFELRVREPWWQEHRMLRSGDPVTNLHVFGPESAEPWKHRVFRDHLRRDVRDRERYASVKRAAAEQANRRGETTMDYNLRKQDAIREIYTRAFRAAGLI
ncbi:hypothetical protein BMH32_07225 [Leucobacter sp. OLJS4]|uniref:GrpB family protein n=1 Tax=unclassified Leucobacter TaxID=2621730 RepID=UPI000C189CAE|nr:MULTISPECIES: GrpB family protein [unclassified Leucobacter]PII84430.1 hypothetical protein BMH25_03955 [Leucobacter sp. OLCALW19]PII88668.1 hypothetical protein BMH26_04685 [Leucobacter sp. OLTLW20]PII90974.1 hypothetical protein BMH27_09485 [Leucobacter sp. OLAS13]PII97721.1 hypothetical protein BMH29_11005 [Leucobacter sp. OLDS2]PIJ01828.1 hypothetical protein BMH28_05570 [Leucobacter sp. OLCS4]